MRTVLDNIVDYRRDDIARLASEHPSENFENQLEPSKRDFYQSLSQDSPAFILECKKASPSKGLIRDDFDVATIVKSYDPYASAISVLAEYRHFQGRFHYLQIASKNSTKPILCKDFIIDAYQIKLARFYGADAILLMLSILNDEEYRQLRDLAHSLNMGVLTEINDEEEAKRAIYLEAKVVGINNRDLRDLSIDTDKTARLSAMIPNDRIIISESGIRNHRDMRALSAHANGFLIGSALMEQDDLDLAIRQMVKGSHKVCGLTRKEDVENAYQAGASFGGLIFVLTSPRGITIDHAKAITNDSPLKFIGVFQNDDVDTIVHIANEVNLYAVQLHGRENQEFITELRAALPTGIKIIKAMSITDQIYPMNHQHVDFYLLDGQFGGSGIPFNWDLLTNIDLDKVFIAGGLNHENVPKALTFNPFGLDMNSGVESTPGEKDRTKLFEMFQVIQNRTLEGAVK